MLRRFLSYFLFLLVLVFLLTGCSEDSLVNEERAIGIALEDIQDYRPNESNFEVYKTEKGDMKIRNWKIIISSEQNMTFYQIDVESGEILDKDNYAEFFEG